MKWLAILFAIAAVLVVPYPSEVSPPWKIQAVDRGGMAVAGCKVTQSWGWIPLDRINFIEQTETDAGGWATFPRRVRWLSLGRRALAFVDAQISFHGNKYGPVFWIIAMRPNQDAAHPALISNMVDRSTLGVVEVNGVLNYRVVMLPPR